MCKVSKRRFYHVHYYDSGSGYVSEQEETARGFVIRFGWGDYYAQWVQSGESVSGVIMIEEPPL